MNRHKFSTILTVCWLGALLLSGCLDVTSTSQVNSNGSIVRTIKFTGDSAAVYRGNFPVALDSSWSKNIVRSSGKDNNFTLTATRTFPDVGEMNDAL